MHSMCTRKRLLSVCFCCVRHIFDRKYTARRQNDITYFLQFLLNFVQSKYNLTVGLCNLLTLVSLYIFRVNIMYVDYMDYM